jgi:carbonic anhydrase
LLPLCGLCGLARESLRAVPLWEQAIQVQIAMQVEQLRRAPVLAAAVECGALRVVGAWYNLESGLVEITVE